MEKRHEFMQQIDKAAKIVDLLGDLPHAVRILEGLLNQTDIDRYPLIHLEVFLFLADIYLDLGKLEDSQRLVEKAEQLEVDKLYPQQSGQRLMRLQRLKDKINT